jgi:Flp pilus assembly protein TadG
LQSTGKKEKTMALLRPCRPSRTGAACIEFAVILLFLMPLLLGVWEVGRLVEVEQFLNNAAREGGRQASTGTLNTAAVQQIVVNYLTANGIPCDPSMVTITNVTSSSRNDPTTAQQLDQFQVTVSIPFDSVRWVILNQITSTKTLSATVVFYSMKDVPLTINTVIPLQ